MLRALLYYAFCPSFVYSSDDPCGHHASAVIMLRALLYYAFYPYFVYSSDDPCGHHASAVIMLLRSSCFCGHHASAVIMLVLFSAVKSPATFAHLSTPVVWHVMLHVPHQTACLPGWDCARQHAQLAVHRTRYPHALAEYQRLCPTDP